MPHGHGNQGIYPPPPPLLPPTQIVGVSFYRNRRYFLAESSWQKEGVHSRQAVSCGQFRRALSGTKQRGSSSTKIKQEHAVRDSERAGSTLEYVLLKQSGFSRSASTGKYLNKY